MELNELEKQVLLFVIDGKTNLEIAEEIGYSEASVKRIVKKLFLFYKISKRVDLVREAMKCSACCLYRKGKFEPQRS